MGLYGRNVIWSTRALVDPNRTMWAYYQHIFLYRNDGLPLRDMFSLGALRMGLGRSGIILPSSSLSPPSTKLLLSPHITTLSSNY